MINVSRTSVPESWFASPIPHKVTKPRDTKPLIANGRISVSTINTDLFPELITWAAIIESQSPASCSQRIPTDVRSKREADADTLHETPPPSPALSLILDPTSLAFGFDQLCLEGLDDCLTYSPRESFEEACWEQATCSRRSGRNSDTQSTPRKFGRRADTYSPLTARGPFSDDDSDTDSKDSLTLGCDAVHLDIVDSGGMSDLHTTGELLTCKEKSFYYGDEERTSFILIDPTYQMPDQKNSVNFFPIPNTSRKTVPNRIAAFCANIPGSLTFVRSPNAS